MKLSKQHITGSEERSKKSRASSNLGPHIINRCPCIALRCFAERCAVFRLQIKHCIRRMTGVAVNYYNENDPKAAAWLRELIAAEIIPAGDVDERSIIDVRPHELTRYTQQHFFAGIGGWSLALRLAGWPADLPVWTGSCPCQPFSAAGNQRGLDDERHLWPEFLRLIAKCKPAIIFGEQVCSVAVTGKQQGKGCSLSEIISVSQLSAPRKASSIQKGRSIRSGQALDGFAEAYRRGLLRGEWDSVQSGWWANMGQSIVGSDKPIVGICSQQYQDSAARGEQRDGGLGRCENARNCQGDNGKADSSIERALRKARQEFDEAVRGAWSAGVRIDLESIGYAFGASDVPAASVGAPHIRQRLFWVADSDGSKLRNRGLQCRRGLLQQPKDEATRGLADTEHNDGRSDQQSRLEGHCAGAWSDYDSIPCLDGKARRVESGTFPLVAGIPKGVVPSGDPSLQEVQATAEGRVMRLRGYGNSIVPQVAAEFIRAFMSIQSQ